MTSATAAAGAPTAAHVPRLHHNPPVPPPSPQVYPVTSKNLNYAPVSVAAVIAIAGGYWLLSARKWFRGPVGDQAVAAPDTEHDADIKVAN